MTGRRYVTEHVCSENVNDRRRPSLMSSKMAQQMNIQRGKRSAAELPINDLSLFSTWLLNTDAMPFGILAMMMKFQSEAEVDAEAWIVADYAL
ncbi:unnamed protein product [Soboliphyme baturini]|uniref:Uncharacterized protein n=1 Tax=Soboliphyme baturini TaxID=241478 RepID=A0A183IUK8_9BILA|nr:unnamed protein product [Soboliphyme baturini]